MVALKIIFHFPYWWYKYSLEWFNRLFKNLLIFLDNRLAVSLMTAMLFVPLFHDISFLGRILSFIFRFTRIIFGSLIILISFTAMLIWLTGWLLLPIGLIWLWSGNWLILTVFWLVDIIRQLKHSDVSPAVKHINSSRDLLNNKAVQKTLALLEIKPKEIADLAIPDFNNWLQLAKNLTSDRPITEQHLLLAWLKLADYRFEAARETVNWLQYQNAWAKMPFIWDKDYQSRPIGGVDRAWIGIPTPTLDRFSLDLTKMAQKKQLPEIFAKEAIIRQISQILSKKTQNNVLVIGEPGSGKTTLIKGLAQEIIRGVNLSSLRFKRLIQLDISSLAAGADSAELNRRIIEIIKEIKASQNIILFVDEVHNLASINQDKPETSDLFAALEPVLSQGEFQFIGATTTKNFKQFIEPNSAFSRLMEVVELPEAKAEETLQILEYLAWERKIKDKVNFSFMALKTIVDLSRHLIHDRVWPDKAVNLLDEAAAKSLANQSGLITSAEIQALISAKTKVPVSQLNRQETELLLNLEKNLSKRIIGQVKAIKAISQAMKRARTGLKNANKPIAAFLFAGPTGVGKTETAKALALEFFGSETTMIRLDMSEYQNQDSLDRLLATLTETVRQKPFSVLLLDEIEKANSKILNVFLQVFDDARLTDADGRLADFNHILIIATTNVGTNTKGNQIVMPVIEKYFAPEWLNRFNGIIIFDPLTLAMAEAVVRLKLNQLKNNLAQQEIVVQFKESTIKKLAQAGWSIKWGGREIERTIQTEIGNVIADKILSGEIKKRKLWTC